MSIRVKICGNRTLSDALISCHSGADAIGLIHGINYASEDEVSLTNASQILKKIPVFVDVVLVTHFMFANQILDVYEHIPTSSIQLQDNISEKEVNIIRDKLVYVKLIKAVHVTGRNSIKMAQDYSTFFDAILLDTKTDSRIGGTGKTHDWRISREIVQSIKPCDVILAGGLTIENVERAIEYVHPYGVDVNSGVDDINGDKNLETAITFVKRAQSSANLIKNDCQFSGVHLAND
ncbi:MAG: phosphoribosylanthranilate isomerase [bacterium]|jgi:phosphoribosylanthranilate isomerase|uniref:phosphoribosylanthranilate isomerase n=1 Tax=Microcystis TaxID=1125 RepID=UPI000261C83A|nr:phosphoribosylanthranilate isomerase [Microcystis aeruginosa]MCZ8126815.1 phosphoribosylanthranilate isomerase [Microcystis sp. LE19-114.1B]MDB9394977.1 phosphoribosylanthranilate isomerase [Microcystis aeruginosa CS-573]MDB9412612.1 phosphoribosylanthranilate isomerase [Microcystis aeruginosa CS-567/02]CCI08728.1 N-(5'-phosphoribosyl)anthranilate isomerase 2 [Microcystis aeruginosa PCC 7941]GCA83947.1 N-(5'-phosphoribosyl)anthranilate isomerase [Microcystis aeruginosa NIES-2522]